MAAWIDLLVMDLGLLRFFFNRPVEVVPGVWRSNQPTPWRLRALRRLGFKAILNLRGEGLSGSFHLERYTCEQEKLALYSLKMSSRRPPSKEQMLELIECLETLAKPMLLHCKSGADRAGLVSAMCVLLGGQGVGEARKQLSIRFLHLKSSSTGMMDAVLDAYAHDVAQEYMPFKEWVTIKYDRSAISAGFIPSPFSKWLVDKVIHRE